MKSLSLLGLLGAALVAQAAPAALPIAEPEPTAPALEARQGAVTVLSSAAVSAFKPYTYFAGAGYCKPAATKAWNCGTNCNALPGFVTVASGGDGTVTQYWFVGYYPTWSSVVVSHQGTDPSKILPLVQDAKFFLEPLRANLFPGVPSGVESHNGFGDSHALSATAVLAAVRTAMSTYKTTKVTIIGHSLGGAIAMLQSVYLKIQLPSTTTFKTVTFGQPRVGNQAWANYVDSFLTDVTHINNRDDPVPILPGRFLGYKHTKGEVHIKDNLQWVSCAGQDNELAGCTVSDVGNILIANVDHHGGPYNGVNIGC